MVHLNSKETKKIIVIVLVFLVTGVIIALLSVRDRQEIPGEFLEARGAAVLVSQKIVALTSDTNIKIQAVNVSDEQGEAQRALLLIQEARVSNNEANQNAIELSRHLQKFAESIEKIPSRKSQELVVAATAIELSLVSEFIVYTKNLNTFLDNVARAVRTGSDEDRRAVARALVEVNKNAVRINELNSEFLAKMEAFDKSL